jgi:hypothetical protein
MFWAASEGRTDRPQAEARGRRTWPGRTPFAAAPLALLPQQQDGCSVPAAVIPHDPPQTAIWG